MAEEMFETYETPTAAFLVCRGHVLKKTWWSQKRCYFSFEDTHEVREALAALAAGDALVEPLEFNRTMVQLKDSVFAKRPASGVR